MFYVDNNEDLLVLCEEISAKTNIIGVDTEFTKQLEYFPTLSIIQISFFNGDMIKNCIIDALSFEINLQPFFEILQNKNIKKVIHSCSQDLEALYRISGKIPVSVEDTQIMASFCGMKSNLSYGNLIKECLKIMVVKDKKIQISDWKIRPLKEEQIKYALNDVDYLLELYIILLKKLNANKNYDYYKNEMKVRYGEFMMKNIVNNSWKKLRFKIGNKTNFYMDCIKSLTRFRENLAIKHNIIKNLILPDNVLKAILNDNLSQTNETIDLDKNDKLKILKRKLIDKIEEVKNLHKVNNIEEKPYIVELKDKNMIAKFTQINDYIISQCKLMQIDAELVQNKLDINSYISNSEKLEDILNSWQLEVFGKRIREIKEQN